MTQSENLRGLIQTVALDAALTEEQAAAAVFSTLRYLTARLPSPVVGQLQEQLQATLGNFSATSTGAVGDAKPK